jgi:hypothetical protein
MTSLNVGLVLLSCTIPNPFNPTTTIRFSLDRSEHVELEIFDLMGRTVETLVSGTLEAGTYTRSFSASDLPGGLHLYRLRSGGRSEIRKMLLMK